MNNHEGNHGEDVKECYFYLDSTPTHSYMKALYKYPQADYPYARLVEENGRRSRLEPEFELLDTGVFDDNHYFDLFVEYAKVAPNDLLIRITVANRGPEPVRPYLLPTLWFRNTWSGGCQHEGCWPKPSIRRASELQLVADHVTLGRFHFAADVGPDSKPPLWLFTENETNLERVFQSRNSAPYRKDAFHDYVIHGKTDAVNPRHLGTKAAAYYVLDMAGEDEATIRLRLSSDEESTDNSIQD